jgi:aminoglycoside 2''-phosphotransferase
MDKLSIYRQTIAAACPDLQITSAVLHTADGQFNDIVSVNHELIFRFPRTPQVAASYAAQAAVLTSLQGKLPLPIPSPLYAVAPDAAWQQSFLAYRRIPGEPLYREALAAIHEPVALRAMAGQLGEFLRSLHHLALDNLPIQPPIDDRREDWEALYAGFRKTLFPHMRPDARQSTSDHFDRYLGDPARFSFQPMLRHGDFGGSNILYDPSTNRISGVIDFESLAFGDPATDAAALSTYGEEFFELCLVAYPEMRTMRDRASFYRGTFALQEAYYGLRDGDQEAFRSGIEAYT